MKNTKIPIIKGHWCKLRVILLSLLYPCLGYSCSDSASSAIPDDWITISTESVSFPYEGGTEKREFVLGQGLDINQIASTLSNKGEDWLTALVDDAHHIKISLQSRSPEFILLILQFALGKDRQLIFRLSEFCQSFLHLFDPAAAASVRSCPLPRAAASRCRSSTSPISGCAPKISWAAFRAWT